MLLERVRIQHYKCLRDVSAEFSNPAAGERTFFPHLLVGVNGSGKSCFLEALGLIFTRMMQGEAPGFPFVLEYRIRQAQVRVRPAGKDAPPDRKLEVTVTSDGGTRQLERVPEEYLPRRIVACSSGSNHLMESVLLSSPRESLSSGLYDLAGREDPDTEREMARLLEQYRALDTNPRVFSIDGKRPGWWRRCSLPLSPTFLTGRWPRATFSCGTSCSAASAAHSARWPLLSRWMRRPFSRPSRRGATAPSTACWPSSSAPSSLTGADRSTAGWCAGPSCPRKGTPAGRTRGGCPL